MPQTSAAPAQPRPVNEPALLDPLSRLAGDPRHTHALIVADHGLDLVRGLIPRVCLAASTLRPGDKPDAADYSLVLTPRYALAR
jgi:hypothetical protein